MAQQRETVSFLSDYGHRDEFVGVVHSVIHSIAPLARVVDINHEIDAFDVRAGSLSLVRSVQYLRPGVVLAVVDPTVGTSRRAIAVEVGDNGEGVFVGPDNGLLAPAVAMTGGARRAVALTNEKYHIAAQGTTFAGRDIFAPVAAHLCNGVDLADLGELIDPVTLVPGVIPLSREDEGKVISEALWVDRFGNVQLNVGLEELARFDDRVAVRHAGEVRVARLVKAFGELGPGELGLLEDSYGMATLVFDQSSVSAQLHMSAGSEITLEEAT